MTPSTITLMYGRMVHPLTQTKTGRMQLSRIPCLMPTQTLAFVRLRKFWEKNSTAFIIHFHTITMISSKSMRFLLFANFFYIQ